MIWCITATHWNGEWNEKCEYVEHQIKSVLIIYLCVVGGEADKVCGLLGVPAWRWPFLCDVSTGWAGECSGRQRTEACWSGAAAGCWVPWMQMCDESLYRRKHTTMMSVMWCNKMARERQSKGKAERVVCFCLSVRMNVRELCRECVYLSSSGTRCNSGHTLWPCDPSCILEDIGFVNSFGTRSVCKKEKCRSALDDTMPRLHQFQKLPLYVSYESSYIDLVRRMK